jgi:hypothetical protein
MSGHVYIFGTNENTSLKLDYLAIHQFIETEVEEESCTHINISQKFSTFKYPTQHPHNLENGRPL